MRILFSSHRFHPSIGGVETVGGILAEEFSALGHQVRVVTRSFSSRDDDGPFEILRRPNPLEVIKQTRWADVCVHNNIGLRTAWPLLWIRKPWVVIHHTWIQRPDGSRDWRDWLKLRALHFATSISISRAMAGSLPGPSTLIPDPYDDLMFREHPGVVRNRDLIMVGRLVSDKGADVLLNALGLLRSSGLTPGLTIVGEGPERARLEALCGELKLSGQVQFVGEKDSKELARLLNEHRLLIVPSRWQEPFGVVALEGIACGCVVVGSCGGGLTEAIGPCGATFPNDQPVPLAGILGELLRHPATLDRFRGQAAAHLQIHGRRAVALRYVEQLERLRPASVWHPPPTVLPASA